MNNPPDDGPMGTGRNHPAASRGGRGNPSAQRGVNRRLFCIGTLEAEQETATADLYSGGGVNLYSHGEHAAGGRKRRTGPFGPALDNGLLS